MPKVSLSAFCARHGSYWRGLGLTRRRLALDMRSTREFGRHVNFRAIVGRLLVGQQTVTKKFVRCYMFLPPTVRCPGLLRLSHALVPVKGRHVCRLVLAWHGTSGWNDVFGEG